MDLTETYAKMSDCEEIQSQKPVASNSGEWWYIDFAGKNEDIWLPRQDQLQEMIGIAFDDVLLLFFEWYLEHPEVKTTALIAGEKIFSIEYLYSMEQLWLAFVMWELHQKKWNGSSWCSAPKDTLVEVADG